MFLIRPGEGSTKRVPRDARKVGDEALLAELTTGRCGPTTLVRIVGCVSVRTSLASAEPDVRVGGARTTRIVLATSYGVHAGVAGSFWPGSAAPCLDASLILSLRATRPPSCHVTSHHSCLRDPLFESAAFLPSVTENCYARDDGAPLRLFSPFSFYFRPRR